MPGKLAEDLGHADGQRHRAAGPADDVFADLRLEVREVAPSGMPSVRVEHRRRRVDGEVVAGVQRRRGDERHDADEAFEQHRAVADRPDVGLLVDHLRRRAGRDQRVEAGDRAAGDRDEHEREERTRDDRAAAADELRERPGICSVGVDDDRRRSTSSAIVPIFMNVLR